jgi:hypothetical protein
MGNGFARIFFVFQKKHCWFVAEKKIVLDLLDRFCAGTVGQPKILDSGSGLMLNALRGQRLSLIDGKMLT